MQTHDAPNSAGHFPTSNSANNHREQACSLCLSLRGNSCSLGRAEGHWKLKRGTSREERRRDETKGNGRKQNEKGSEMVSFLWGDTGEFECEFRPDERSSPFLWHTKCSPFHFKKQANKNSSGLNYIDKQRARHGFVWPLAIPVRFVYWLPNASAREPYASTAW